MKPSLTLGAALRDHIRAAVERAPRQHSKRTPACPPLSEIPRIAAAEWSPGDDLEHIKACEAYCHKIIAIQWRINPPTAPLLWRSGAGELPELDGAMRLFCDEHPLVKKAMAVITRTIKEARTSTDRLRRSFGGVAITFRESGSVPTAGAFADDEKPLYYWSWTSTDEHLHCALEETEDGILQVRIDDTAGSYASRTVRVHLLFADSEPLEVDVFMRETGSDGSIGIKPIGVFADLGPRLSEGFGGITFPI